MVRIRLKPTGKSVQPSFKIVVINDQANLFSKYIASVGFYDPIKKNINIDEELALKFLLEGAQPTATVRSLFKRKGIIEKLHNIKVNQKKLQKEAKNKELLSSSNATKQGTTVDQK